MTNTQLWLGVAIPSLLIVLSLIQTNARLTDLKENLTQRLDDGITRIEQRLSRIEQRLDLVESDHKQFFSVTGKMEGRIDELARRSPRSGDTCISDRHQLLLNLYAQE